MSGLGVEFSAGSGSIAPQNFRDTGWPSPERRIERRLPVLISQVHAGVMLQQHLRNGNVVAGSGQMQWRPSGSVMTVDVGSGSQKIWNRFCLAIFSRITEGRAISHHAIGIGPLLKQRLQEFCAIASPHTHHQRRVLVGWGGSMAIPGEDTFDPIAQGRMVTIIEFPRIRIRAGFQGLELIGGISVDERIQQACIGIFTRRGVQQQACWSDQKKEEQGIEGYSALIRLAHRRPSAMHFSIIGTVGNPLSELPCSMSNQSYPTERPGTAFHKGLFLTF
jgi:hypothetical protein